MHSGEQGRLIGQCSEARVELALRDGKMPEWMGRFRRATLEEEAKKIDFVVESDVGPLYLQVKTSYRDAFMFKGDHRGPRPIGVVSVGRKSPARIAKDVCNALSYARNRVLEKRGRHAD